MKTSEEEQEEFQRLLDEAQRKYDQEQEFKESARKYAEDMGIEYPTWDN